MQTEEEELVDKLSAGGVPNKPAGALVMSAGRPADAPPMVWVFGLA